MSMKYRRLGKTGLRVSVVGVGTWQFGGEWGKHFCEAEVSTILGRAKELGINLIDTAECYGDHLSESLVGKAIEHDREDWIVATKFGHRYKGHLDRGDLFGPDEVRRQLEDSLRALRTDVIDLYQFHSGNDAAFVNDDLWTMLRQQVEAGKVRFLGISISSGIDPQLQASRASEVGVSVLQVVYNRLERRAEETTFQHSIAQDLGVLARVPLASGLLSGKYAPGTRFTTASDVRASRDEDRILRQLQQVEAIRKAEVPSGVPMPQWALAWCLHRPAVSAVIPGCKTVQQVESNAGAADLDLVRDDHPQAVA